MTLLRNPTRLTLAIAVIAAGLADPSLAGGGPENVLVVVNRDSWASLAVANHFIRLRRIPPSNVLYLEDVGGPDSIPIEQFREQVLKPIRQALAARGTRQQVDYVAYSSDLPWSVSLRGDTAGQQLPRVLTPVGSLNGLTFLYERVEAGGLTYLQPAANSYFRRPLSPTPNLTRDQAAVVQKALALIKEKQWAAAVEQLTAVIDKQPRHPGLLYNLGCCLARQEKPEAAVKALHKAVAAGFANRRHAEQDPDLASLRERDDFRQLLKTIKPQLVDVEPTTAFPGRGQAVAAPSPHHFLSTVLGVTSGRGNSLDEVRRCLDTAAAADGVRPQGTIYFPTNKNVRSTTRDGLYPSAIELLKREGVAAVTQPGTIPKGRDDVQGAMIGTASFDWQAGGSRILPGAIVEHLTSFGGVMRHGAGQTPLSELIAHGAAGSSGTVTEPFALQAKFPLPFVHVHYARGCSLAESFYQSVALPYQLLIVGDPLCQPWAVRPKFKLDGVPTARIDGKFTLTPVVAADSAPVARFELFVDGRLVERQPKAEPLVIDTSDWAPGVHLLAVVAVGAGPVATQARQAFSVETGDGRLQPSLTVESARVPLDGSVRVQVEAGGADSVEVEVNSRSLGAVADDGTLQIPAAKLGLGSVELRAVAKLKDGRRAVGAAVPVEVTVSDPLAPTSSPAKLQPGLRLRWEDGSQKVLAATPAAKWLAEEKPEPGAKFTLTGYIELKQDALCQLQLSGNVPCQVEVNGRPLAAVADPRWHYLPVSLQAGLHRVKVTGTAVAKPRLDLRFGSRGTQDLSAKSGFKCAVDKK